MRSILIQTISIGLIYLLVGLFNVYSTKDRSCKGNVVKSNIACLIVGIIGTLFFCGLGIWFLLQTREAASWSLFGIGILLTSIIIFYFQCRIFYDDEKFIVRNFFGKKKTIIYKDIIRIEQGLDIIIKTDKDKIVVYNYLIGRGDFLRMIVSRVPEALAENAQKATDHPVVRPFREAVWRPGDSIFLYVLLYLVIASLFVICFFAGDKWIAVFCLGVFFTLLWSAFVFVSIHSAKRAHSSEFWRKVAKYCFKEGYLKDD